MPELIAYGLVLGSIITLGAVGLTLIYGIANFANFAHGDLMTLGAYVGLFVIATLVPGLGLEPERIGPFSFGWPLLVAFLPAMLLVGLFGIATDRLIFLRLRQRRVPPVILAIASLGVAFVLRSLIYLIWGAQTTGYSRGVRQTFEIFGVRLRWDQLVIFVLAWTMVIALYLFLQRTRTGKALRAMADNPDLARISGIATERMLMLTWLIGGALAAAAGIMLGMDSQLQPEMGWEFLLPLFAAVILGGIGDPYGALAGGMVIGLAQQMSTYWLTPSYKPAVAFIILIVILLVRPRGIFGSR